MTFPPLPLPFREQLLQTATNVVDEETVDAIRLFCQTVPDLETAYVCAAERTHEGGEPTRVMILAVKLGGQGDGDSDSLYLSRRFLHDHPELMHRLGLRVLTDRAIAAFEHHGIRVYTRSAD